MGLYNKVNTVSTEYTNYNIDNVSFRAFNDFVYENGNPLFIGSDGNIYQLKSLGIFELIGAKPSNLNTSTQSLYQQFGNCILNVTRSTTTYTATYSLNYGETWNTFVFDSSVLPKNLSYSPSPDYNFGFAYLNNSLGLYAFVRRYTGSGYTSYGYTFAYTNDFENVNVGYNGGSSFPSATTDKIECVKINNNTIAIREGYSLLVFNNFNNYSENIITTGAISPLSENIIRTTTNFNSQAINPPLFAYKYENGEITRFGPFTDEITSGFTLQNWLYYNNCIYKWAISTPAWMCELYKIDLNDLTETVFGFSVNIQTTVPYAKIVNNYLVFGYSNSLLIGMLNLDNNKFFLFNKVEAINNYAIYVEQDKPNHFVIYTPTNYTETTSRSITPEERTTIYRNDYSTITGSQVLENAVRSVNHSKHSVTLGNIDVGNATINNIVITSNPYQKSQVSNTRRETYIQNFTNIKITTTTPIIGNINANNFSFGSNNKRWYAIESRVPSSNYLYQAVSQAFNDQTDINTRFPLDTADLENLGIQQVQDNALLVDTTWRNDLSLTGISYEVTNINKIDNYNVTFDCKIITRTSLFSISSYGTFGYEVTTDISEAQDITITINANSTKTTNESFVFSIDTQNNEYVQNNPLSRSDNELFSLDNTFFQEQANAIIQANKDGRMILTVNSTSDLNLYLGKELQVELKDGTLANNGATFEVTGIKEKFTGINWKQTYTLKEKKSST